MPPSRARPGGTRGESGEVRAAGGVVWREGAQGVEVLLVRRPRYDDWSMPKGKLEAADRDDEACALREVAEETGLRCALDQELATVHYVDDRGRNKSVRYWAMHEISPADHPFVANDEVDEIAWLALADAERRIQYEGDRDVLSAFGAWYRTASGS